MAQDDRKFNPFDDQQTLTGHGEISEGLPPRQIGGAPGYGTHGMGYAHGTGAFGVYGVPRDVAQEYVETSRSHRSGAFDQPHGRIGYGWEGAFGSEGEYSARSDRVRPGGRPSGYAPQHGAAAQPQRNVRRGPKNYTRSDDRIKEEIFDAIARDQRIDASDVTIDVQGAKVTLYGSVAHRQMKHWIEDIAAECYGVTDVDNKLTVALAAASPADRKMSPGGVAH
jgi:hypothetical protein